MDMTKLRAQLADLHPLSFGWAVACCRGDEPMAEDCLQSAYMKVLEGQAQFGERSEFKTWFFGVVRNAAREERRRHLLRKAGLLRYQPPMDAPPDPGRELARRESHDAMRAALARLSQRQQEVLHLVFYQDMTIEAAAKVMRVSLGSARTHYERGKRQLRKHLGGQADESQ